MNKREENRGKKTEGKKEEKRRSHRDRMHACMHATRVGERMPFVVYGLEEAFLFLFFFSLDVSVCEDLRKG